MLVFSSALMTQSLGPKASPSQTPWYRSSTRPAFSANRSSRGKIQLRYSHGRMASASSHRQTVRPLIEATMPRRTASRAMSVQLNREKGSPTSLGSSQARAFTSTTTSGGKKIRPTPARAFLQAAQALLAEPFPPLADDLPGQIQTCGDLLVFQALGRQQDDLRPDDVTIR